MAKLKEQQEAIRLRQQGLSYREIRLQIPVSKGTLSLWLRNYPLSRKQLQRLKDQRHSGIEKFRETMRKKREARLTQTYQEQKQKWLPLSDNELFLAGLFLYWGEGSKADRHLISISNTDPTVIKVAMHWMQKSLHLPLEKIKVRLQLYSDMDIKKTISFWSDTLGIPKSHFGKTYVKQTKRSKIHHKGFGYGTCAVYCHKTVIKEQLLMTIQAMADHFDSQVGRTIGMKSIYTS